MYKLILKPFLFLLKPERAHYFVFGMLKVLFAIPGVRAVFTAIYRVNKKGLEKEVFGIKFPNPVGLAAGFDKDARCFNELWSFGFGFIEIGTLTPKPQPGNPKQRLFRLPKDHALINRMGFNNSGVDNAVKRLKNKRKGLIIGGNIGKNKITPNENATEDYVTTFKSLHAVVDYFVVNVSSPNTPNLRALQEKEPLKELLNSLVSLNNTYPVQKPILLKIAPDLTNHQLDDIVEIALETNLSGIIATNTTISRDHLKTSPSLVESIGNGGLSGKPLTKRSTEVIRYLADKLNKKVPVIGVGGIHSAEDAKEKLEAGADLVQIYTGFIYEGPGLVKKILKAL